MTQKIGLSCGDRYNGDKCITRHFLMVKEIDGGNKMSHPYYLRGESLGLGKIESLRNINHI